MEIDIRPMLPNDRAAVLAMLEAIPEFDRTDRAVATGVIEEYLARPEASGYNIHVAEGDGSVVGYVSFGPEMEAPDVWEVYWVAVAPELQGQGIGRRLMAFAEKAMAARKARLILVETSGRPDYAKTRHFYQVLGYTEAARIRDFYAPGDDKVIYEKR